MKVITFCSFKGGTGKTTLSANVACYLAEKKNKKVLLIDLDPQANLTTYMWGDSADSFTSSELLVNGWDFDSFVKKTTTKNLSIIPSEITSEVFRNQASGTGSFFQGNLSNVLKKSSNFDFCIIDTPPSLGFLAKEAFLAADGLVVCLSPEPFSVVGLHKIKEFSDSIPNLNIKIFGVAISFWETRNSTNNLYINSVNSVFSGNIPRYLIRRDISFSRAILKEKPVFSVYPNSRASSDIKTLSDGIYKEVFSLSLESIR
ncbi:ParA family protein [Chlamydiifrater phoenicopteri]|uniref:ParA family protein n=1 Tax=Chlamydiifrater phoenicopteri TaxID=2681469 RepID=UPI001BD15064|nr:ParA family protein [Chlamydiifrater phoenicopteri]